MAVPEAKAVLTSEPLPATDQLPLPPPDGASPPKTPAVTAPLTEVDRAMQRISGIKNVQGLIIVDKDGTILRSTFTDDNVTTNYATHVVGLATMARSSIRELDNQTELQMLRVRSETHEFVIVPEAQFTLIVGQALKDPVIEEKDEEASLDNESIE
ncbi:hypothetical protein KP509_26G051500 [Ceratopteris richardii]|uniref:Roadblock/LAMTOR2 domain-containing protein n=1 Tax=Ceratopteris richardii TaxID=49495 RepID=A0A8T2RL11_CERRI|nr:hypothetical protein KP509_26G051500 [Ceratopteris richardii]